MAKEWRTIDFRPAPPGWRAITLTDADPGWHAWVVAGWLIQERGVVDYDGEVVGDDDVPARDRVRRVVAAVHEASDGGELFPAELTLHHLWFIAGPGDSDPTAEEVAQRREELRTAAEHRRRQATPDIDPTEEPDQP